MDICPEDNKRANNILSAFALVKQTSLRSLVLKEIFYNWKTNNLQLYP